MKIMRKHILKTALILSAFGLGGCGSTFIETTSAVANFKVSDLNKVGDFKIEPWVKPFERSNLADPIMSSSRNPVAIAYAKHVSESREGARGADGGAGGGCGCN
jgi:hypothetical protein